MRILLDTQAWLWLQATADRLSDEALTVASDPGNDLYLSAASAWEIAIKYALGKLPLPEPPAEYVPTRLRTSGVAQLPVDQRHALHVASLPHHHRDPFDRLLIAQAQLDQLVLLTSDPAFRSYELKLLSAE